MDITEVSKSSTTTWSACGSPTEPSKPSTWAPYLHGPVFAAIRTDPAAFGSVRVDRDAGTIVWPKRGRPRPRRPLRRPPLGPDGNTNPSQLTTGNPRQAITSILATAQA
jgi:hypothetical protein